MPIKNKFIKKKMILLALESSAESSSVAIWQNSKLLSYQIIEAKFGLETPKILMARITIGIDS